MKRKIGEHLLRFWSFQEHPDPEDIWRVIKKYELSHIEGTVDEIETDGKDVNGLRVKLDYIDGYPLEHYSKIRKDICPTGPLSVYGIGDGSRLGNKVGYITATFLDDEKISTLHASRGDDIVAVGAFDFREVKDFDHYDLYIWEFWNRRTDIKIQFGDYSIKTKEIASSLKERYYYHSGRGWMKLETDTTPTVQTRQPGRLQKLLRRK